MVPNASCYRPMNTNGRASDNDSRDSLSLCNPHSNSNHTPSSLTSRPHSHVTRNTTLPNNRSHWEAIHVKDDNHNNKGGSSTHSPKIKNSIYSQRRTTFPYLLSAVAQEFKQRMVLNDRIKNSIEYKNVFDGQQAVVKSLAPGIHVYSSFLYLCAGQIDGHS